MIFKLLRIDRPQAQPASSSHLEWPTAPQPYCSLLRPGTRVSGFFLGVAVTDIVSLKLDQCLLGCLLGSNVTFKLFIASLLLRCGVQALRLVWTRAPFPSTSSPTGTGESCIWWILGSVVGAYALASRTVARGHTHCSIRHPIEAVHLASTSSPHRGLHSCSTRSATLELSFSKFE